MADRRVLLAVSLKMYFDPERTLVWSREVAEIAHTHSAVSSGHVQLVVLPSLPVLPAVVKVFAGSPVVVGAQDLFYEDRGPFTGAVSGADLARIGCRAVEVGHIERRRVFGEDDRVINLKMHAAWRNGLTPLLCVGEESRGGVAEAIRACERQLTAALHGAEAQSEPRPLIVAYEPTWAIGQEAPADLPHVTAVTTALRAFLDARLAFAGASVIYGGSAGLGMLGRLDGTADGLFLGRFVHDASALRSVLDEILQPR